MIAGSAVALALIAGAGGAAAQTKSQQPHMQDAMTHLQAARADLDKATRDKGGHRAKAVQLVDQAMAEVKQGMAAGAIDAERHEHQMQKK